MIKKRFPFAFHLFNDCFFSIIGINSMLLEVNSITDADKRHNYLALDAFVTSNRSIISNNKFIKPC